MEKKDVEKQWSLAERWSPDDIRGITDRIELAKNQSIGSLTSVIEIIETLEFLHGMAPDFPLPQQCYFREAVDELVGLAIGHLENFRVNF